MNFTGNVGIHNKFEIEKVDVRTGKVTQRAEAYNIIVDAMWTRICARNTYFNTIVFGSGTGTLSTARTTLFTAMGNKTVTHVERNYIASTPSSGELYWKQKITLLPEEYQNTSITEVGVGHTTTSIVTHALIKDAEGNPIAVTKGTFDQITIYATIYITLGDISYGNTEWWGVYNDYSYNLLVRYLLGEETNLNGGYRVHQSQVGDIGTATASITLTADASNKKIIFPVTRYNTTSANNAYGIKYISYGSLTANKLNDRIFRTAIPSNNVFSNFDITGEIIGNGDGIEDTFDLQWHDIVNNSESVYVNGVLKTRGVDYSLNNVDGLLLGNTLVRDMGGKDYTTGIAIINNKFIIISGYSSPAGGSITAEISVYIFDAENGLLGDKIQSITNIADYPQCITMTPNQKYLAVGMNQNNASISLILYNFDTENGLIGSIISNPVTIPTSGFIRSIAFTQDGNYMIIGGSFTGKMAIYEFDQVNGIIGDKLNFTDTLTSSVYGVAISPQDNYIAICGLFTNNIAVYPFDSINGVIGTKLNILTPLSTYTYSNIEFSHDGKYIIVGERVSPYYSIYAFDPINGIVGSKLTIPEPLTGESRVVAFSNDSSLIAIGTYASPYIHLYEFDAINGVIGNSYPTAQSDSIRGDILFSESDKYMLLGYSGSNLVISEVFKNWITSTQIQFTTPPALNAVITADYSVDYIPKDTNHVLDIGFALQFSDGNVV